MKLKIYIIIIVFLILSCDKQTELDINKYKYMPVLLKQADLAKSVSYKTDRKIKSFDKIYLKGDKIYVNEKYEGIFIINNQDSLNPFIEGFIKIPGCIDLAIKNNILYADNAVDLVAINLNNLPEINITERVSSVFPELTPPNQESVPYPYLIGNRPDSTVIVAWELNPNYKENIYND